MPFPGLRKNFLDGTAPHVASRIASLTAPLKTARIDGLGKEFT
jgi:hypothetical protein